MDRGSGEDGDGELHATATWVIGAIVRGLLAVDGEAEAVAEVVDRLAGQALSRQAFRTPEPRRLPACRHLPEAVAGAVAVDSGVAAAIAAVEDRLDWRQNASYSDAAMGQPGYMASYAYAELVGPTGFWPGDDFLLGLLLLGPGLHYPDHCHPAPELYWLLTGPSDWKRGAGGFITRPAGEVIWHRPFVVHATRTGAEPLLAVWAWTRDVAEPARLVGR